MSTITSAELLQAARARAIVAEARPGDLALYVGGTLVCTLPPGAAGLAYGRLGSLPGELPSTLKVFSNDGPGPTFDLPLQGLTWAEAEIIADAMAEAFERAET